MPPAAHIVLLAKRRFGAASPLLRKLLFRPLGSYALDAASAAPHASVSLLATESSLDGSIAARIPADRLVLEPGEAASAIASRLDGFFSGRAAFIELEGADDLGSLAAAESELRRRTNLRLLSE